MRFQTSLLCHPTPRFFLLSIPFLLFRFSFPLLSFASVSPFPSPSFRVPFSPPLSCLSVFFPHLASVSVSPSLNFCRLLPPSLYFSVPPSIFPFSPPFCITDILLRFLFLFLLHPFFPFFYVFFLFQSVVQTFFQKFLWVLFLLLPCQASILLCHFSCSLLPFPSCCSLLSIVAFLFSIFALDRISS